MGKERACENVTKTLAAERDPAAVAGEAVPGFARLAVDRIEASIRLLTLYGLGL